MIAERSVASRGVRILMLLRNPFTRDARVMREARSAVAAGHEVTVLCLQVGTLPRDEHLGQVRVVRGVRTGRWAGPTITGGAGTTPKVGRDPGRVSLSSLRARRAMFAAGILARDAWLDRAFIRAASRLPVPQLVHAHDLNTLAAGAVIAKRSKARLVYDAHELYPDITGLTPLERAAWSFVERRSIRRADAVIVPTPARGEVLQERYGIDAPTVVMNCPEPPETVTPDPRISDLRRPGERLVLYAGGFTPNRGLEGIVRAVGAQPGVRLVMLGWGPLEPALRAAASTHGDAVVFAGAVEPDCVVAAAAAADIGLVPYEAIGLNNQLAAPNKLFEYLHAGLAVCASDLPDLKSIIEGEGIGAVFDASDPASVVAAIHGVMSGDLDGMRARARALAPSFTWSAQAARLLKLYEAFSD